MTKTDKRFHVAVFNDNTVRFIDYKEDNNLISIRFKEHEDAIDCRDALMYQCDLMNKLYEENQDLKSFNKDLAENLSACANARISKDDWIEKLTEENEQLRQKVDFYKYFQKDARELEKENEELKQQLYCDDEEGVCNICKHHYLIKDDELELGYYNSRCKKGHYECARVSLKHCEDFEKGLKSE